MRIYSEVRETLFAAESRPAHIPAPRCNIIPQCVPLISAVVRNLSGAVLLSEALRPAARPAGPAGSGWQRYLSAAADADKVGMFHRRRTRIPHQKSNKRGRVSRELAACCP